MYDYCAFFSKNRQTRKNNHNTGLAFWVFLKRTTLTMPSADPDVQSLVRTVRVLKTVWRESRPIMWNELVQFLELLLRQGRGRMKFNSFTLGLNKGKGRDRRGKKKNEEKRKNKRRSGWFCRCENMMVYWIKKNLRANNVFPDRRWAVQFFWSSKNRSNR